MNPENDQSGDVPKLVPITDPAYKGKQAEALTVTEQQSLLDTMPAAGPSSESADEAAGSAIEEQPLLEQIPPSPVRSINEPSGSRWQPPNRADSPPPYLDIEWNGDRVQCVKSTDAKLGTQGDHLGSLALDVGKDLAVFVGTVLKFPATVTYLVTKTLHEIPKVYGDDTVRDYGNVTDTSSGMSVAGQCLFLGIYDGVTGIVSQPLSGAQKGGATGFLIGFAKGLGGAAIKPAEAGCGVAGYPLMGMLRDVQKLSRVRLGSRRSNEEGGSVRLE